MKVWQLSCVVAATTAMIVAAICEMAAMRPSIARANAVLEANSNIATRSVTVVAESSVMPPNAIVEAAFRAVEQNALARADVTGSISQGRILAFAEDVADAAWLKSDAVPLRLDRPPLPADAVDAAKRELPYLKYYVYSELPPPKKPAVIALEALSDIPLGTPVEEIKRAADAFGLDFNFMKAVAKIESDFDPKQRTGSYIGLFQLSKAEFKEFGSGDITDPRDNAVAAAEKFATEAALFEYVTHKKPTFSDLYLIHQQGWQGAAEHISHPGRLAWKSMCATDEGMAKGERWCKRAIWGNTLPAVKHEWKSVDRLTSGAFVAMWRDRVDSLYARYAETGVALAEQPKSADVQQ